MFSFLLVFLFWLSTKLIFQKLDTMASTWRQNVTHTLFTNSDFDIHFNGAGIHQSAAQYFDKFYEFRIFLF